MGQPKVKGETGGFSVPELIILLAVVISRCCAVVYFILGLILRYDEDIINDGLLDTIDRVSLGELPLGTTLRYIAFSLLVYFPLISVLGIAGIFGAFCRNRILLIVHVVFSLIFIIIGVLYMAILAWILAELHYGLKDSFTAEYEQFSTTSVPHSNSDYISGWWNLFHTLRCCGSVGFSTTASLPSIWGYQSCTYTRGCYDVYRGRLRTYGSIYIAVIAVNLICEVIGIIMSDVIFRKTREKEKWSIFWTLLQFVKKHWHENRSILMCSTVTIFNMVLNAVLLVVLFIKFLGFGNDDTMYSELFRVYRGMINLGYLADGTMIALVTVGLLTLLLRGLFFLGIFISNLTVMSLYIGSGVFMVLGDIVFIFLSSYFLSLLYCCYDEAEQCFTKTITRGRHGLMVGMFSFCSKGSEFFVRAMALSTVCFSDQTGKSICGHYTNSLQRVFAFLISFVLIRLTTNIIDIVTADRTYKAIMVKSSPDDGDSASGFIYKAVKDVWGIFKLNTMSKVTVSWNMITAFVEFCLWVALIGFRIGPNHDDSLTSWFWDVYKDYFIIGRLEDGIIIGCIIFLPICLFLKSLLFVGMKKQSKLLMIIYVLIEIFLLCGEIVTFVFFTYVMRAVYCCLDNGAYRCHFKHNEEASYSKLPKCEDIFEHGITLSWVFTVFCILHILSKIVQIILADRTYKDSVSKLKTEDQSPHGVLYEIFTQVVTLMKLLKRNKIKSATVSWNIFLIVMETSLWITLIVVRYAPYTHDYALTDHYWTARFADMNIGIVRDGIFIALIVAVPLFTAVKITLFVAIKRNSTKAHVFCFVAECIFFCLEIVILVFQAFVIVADCGDVCYRARRLLWIFTTFYIIHMLSKIVSAVLIDRLYKYLPTVQENPDPSGVAYMIWRDGVLRVFNRVFTVVQVAILVIEALFLISCCVFYFSYPFSSALSNLKNYLHSFYKNNYSLGTLFDGLTITMIALVSVTMVARGISLLCMVRGWNRVLVSIFIFFVVLIIGELVILAQSTYLMDLAYCCLDVDRYGCSFTVNTSYFNQFCEKSGKLTFDSIGVGTAFLVVHIISHVLIVALIDQLYKKMQEKQSLRRGIFMSAFAALRDKWRFRIAEQNLIVSLRVFVGIHIGYFVLGLIFWIGVFLMCISPGYLTTRTSAAIYNVTKGPLIMGGVMEGVYISTLSGMPVIFGNSVFCVALIFRRKHMKAFYVTVMITQVIIILAHVVVLAFSAMLADLSRCCLAGQDTCDFGNMPSDFCSQIGLVERVSFSLSVTFTLISLVFHGIAAFFLLRIMTIIFKIQPDSDSRIPLRETNMDKLPGAIGNRSIISNASVRTEYM